MFATNSTTAPPNSVPGIEPTPPTTRPTNSATASGKVKLSGATNWIAMAPRAPAAPGGRALPREAERCGERELDPQGPPRDRMVADRDRGAPGAARHQVGGAKEEERRHAD